MSQSLISLTADTPMRLDAFLASAHDVKSRAVAQRYIKEGFVKLNNKVIRKSSHQVKENDNITLVILEKKIPQRTLAKFPPLDVLYDYKDCMIINKPAGIAVHAGNGMKSDDVTLIDLLRAHFEGSALPFSDAEVLVHRLDKETTGCLLIAKHPKAHMILQQLFATRQIRKTYLALVYHIPSPARALIDSPIGRHINERTKMSVMQTGKTRTAQTQYETLDTGEDVALLSCDLQTGRTHQIRVHLASIGHPILGDGKYCSRESRDMAHTHGIDFLCLQAWKLAFTSPFTGKEIAVHSPIRKELAELLNTLSIRKPTH